MILKRILHLVLSIPLAVFFIWIVARQINFHELRRHLLVVVYHGLSRDWWLSLPDMCAGSISCA
jgi:hypothetical protein